MKPNPSGIAKFSTGQMVEFTLTLPREREFPFRAQLWLQIAEPDGAIITLPVYYDGNEIWRVRHTPQVEGIHRVTSLLEGPDAESSLAVQGATVEPDEFFAEGKPSRGFLRRNPHSTQRFQYEDGTPYFPIGFNLGWAAIDDYPVIFGKMESSGLNWSRVWMNHWASMTLDWVMGRQLEPWELDLDVARKWDRIILAAEENNIAIQLVFQSHGQFSTTVNPVWQEHPWNIENGGWLQHPEEFFTDEKARELTKAKYRYIVARWGYSTAIMAWELFNEVEFTDGYVGRELLGIWKNIETHGIANLETGRLIAALYERLETENPGEARFRMEQFGNNLKSMLGGNQQLADYGLGRHRVAQWHREMADYIRSIDPYKHMITTSSLPIESSTWESMDFYQAHIYRREMVLPLARLPQSYDSIGKPWFIAEMGDHSMLDPHKADGRHMHGMIWAGIFSGAAGAAQVWAWDKVEEWNLFPSFEILTEFASRSRIAQSEFKPVDARFHPLPAPVGQPVRPAAFAITSGGTTLLWLCDLNGVAVPQSFSVSGHVEIPGLSNEDSVQIEWTNTRSGETTTTNHHPAHGQGIKTPEFFGDIAAIIRHRHPIQHRSK